MTGINYLDFDLCLERVGDGLRARVIDSPAGQASAEFRIPFSDLELENFLLKVGRPRRELRRDARRQDWSQSEAIKTLGGRLYEAVFEDEVRACLRSSLDEAERNGAGLRIRLRLVDLPELSDLPWEFLYSQARNRFLCLSVETPVVRYLELAERIRPLTVQPPLQVLVMISSPSDYPQLDVEQEWENLRSSLADWEQKDLVALTRLEDASLGMLQRRLRRGQYHIFHFIGHGGFDERASDGVLILEDDERRGRPVSGEDLGTLLHDHRPLRLAVLNACEGARTSRTDPFAGMAQSLVQQGIPAVIAMQFEITDDAAITFAHEFYGAVADGYPVDAALSESRKAIFARGNDLEWATPVLYMRSADGRVFNVQGSSGEVRREALAAAAAAGAATPAPSVAASDPTPSAAVPPPNPTVVTQPPNPTVVAPLPNPPVVTPAGPDVVAAPPPTVAASAAVPLSESAGSEPPKPQVVAQGAGAAAIQGQPAGLGIAGVAGGPLVGQGSPSVEQHGDYVIVERRGIGRLLAGAAAALVVLIALIWLSGLLRTSDERPAAAATASSGVGNALGTLSSSSPATLTSEAAAPATATLPPTSPPQGTPGAAASAEPELPVVISLPPTHTPTAATTPITAAGAVECTVVYGGSNDLNMRNGPSVSDPVVRTLSRGNRLFAFARSADEFGEWLHVRTERGDEGWVRWKVNDVQYVSCGDLAVLPLIGTPAPRVGLFDGDWVTNFGTLRLEQAGADVRGEYQNLFANVTGAVEGSVQGNRFSGAWTGGGGSGRVDRWDLARDENSFLGFFSGSRSGQFTWCGARPGYKFPDGCSFAGNWILGLDGRTDCAMVLERVDMQVRGTYCYGSLTGTLVYSGDGAVTYLSGSWKTPNDGETGVLRFVMPGYDARQFSGNWNDTEEWCGWREGTPKPDPCFSR